MIKSISSNSAYLQVHGGFAAVGPYFQATTAPSTPPSAGTLRYDPMSQNLQVFDGYNWATYSNSHTMVGLNADAEAAIKWAIAKHKEEQELEELMARSPALRDAYEKFQIVKTLATNENRQPA